MHGVLPRAFTVGGAINNRAAPGAGINQGSHGNMSSDTPRATERSEGGSRSRRPTRRAILTEQIVTRISKNTLIELEDYAYANDLTVAQISRRAIHQFLHPPETQVQQRERFEEAP